MPAKTVNVNLLGEQDLARTPLGRIVSWATTYGRYIMIGTEVVVLLVFISRFSLDRKLTDLKEEINQKQAIIAANQDFENEFRSLQDQIGKIRTLLTLQEKPLILLEELHILLPPDVYFESIDLTPEKLVIKGVAGTTLGFSQFLANLNASKNLTQIEINDIKKRLPVGTQFTLAANVSAKVSP